MSKNNDPFGLKAMGNSKMSKSSKVDPIFGKSTTSDFVKGAFTVAVALPLIGVGLQALDSTT